MSEDQSSAANVKPGLVFYTTAGCHLCECAAEMLEYLQRESGLVVQEIDISSAEELVERYGIRIPVVKNPVSEEELGWPFSMEQLASLV